MSAITDSLERPLLAGLEIDKAPPGNQLKEILRNTISGRNWQKDWRNLGVKAALSACGFAGRIAYLPQMQRLANGNTALSAFYKTMCLPVYSTDYIWASVRMANEIRARGLSSSQDIANTRFNCSKTTFQTLTVALPIILGIIAQLPLIALALKYNPDNPAMVALTTMDAVMPIYSVYILLALWAKKCRNQTDAPNQTLLSNLELLKQDLLLKKFDRLDVLLGDAGSLDKVESLHRLMNAPLEDQPVPQDNACKRISTFSAKASGLLLTAVQLAWLGVFTYEGAARFYDDPAVDSMVTIFAVLINAALIGTLFVDTHLQIVKSVEERIQKKPSFTFISETVSPKLSSSVKVACVAFVLFQSMAAIQISRDYLPAEYVIPNAIVLSLAFIIPAYFPVRQLTDWGLQEIYLKQGTPEQKRILTLYQQLERLSTELSYSSSSNISDLGTHSAETFLEV